MRRSLGTGAATPGKDPLEKALNTLASSGVAVVVAAGNDGGSGACVFSPHPNPTA